MKKRIDFKELKQRVTMEQILNHYGLRDQMTGSSDQLRGNNPFDPDSENTTRFSVSLSKNCWNVWGTDLSGNVIDFVKEREQTSFVEAAKLIDGWFPKGQQSANPKRAEKRTKQEPHVKQIQEEELSEGPEFNPPLSFTLKNLDPTHPYLYERGLSDQTIARFGVGFASKGILKGRIAIPIHNANGEIVAYIGRYPGVPPEGTPRYRLPKGFKKSLEVFNIHAVDSDSPEPLVIVEGVFDCIHIWQSGWQSVIALMGASLSQQQEELIRNRWNGRILTMLDDDSAGKEGTDKLLAGLGRSHWIKAASLPDGIIQPDALSKEQLDDLLSV